MMESMVIMPMTRGTVSKRTLREGMGDNLRWMVNGMGGDDIGDREGGGGGNMKDDDGNGSVVKLRTLECASVVMMDGGESWSTRTAGGAGEIVCTTLWAASTHITPS